MRRAALGQPILFTGRLAAGLDPTNRRSLPVRVRNASPPLSYVTVSVHQLEPRDVAEAPDWGKGYITWPPRRRFFSRAHGSPTESHGSDNHEGAALQSQVKHFVHIRMRRSALPRHHQPL